MPFLAIPALLAALALTACGPVAPEAERSDQRTVLALGHLRQETLLCVPTAAAIVTSYYGDPQEPRRLKALSLGRAYDPAAAFDHFSITPYRDLIRGLQSLGYAWSEETYPDTAAGFSAGIERIEAELRAGRPVLADLSLGSLGHTVVLTGFDAEKRRLFMVDPDAPAPGRREIGYDEFATIWNESAYGGSFRALIRTDRKPV